MIVVVAVFAAVDVVFGDCNSPDSVSTLQVLAVIRCYRKHPAFSP